MSNKACTFLPKKIGRDLMIALKSKFGYETAKNAMLKGALNPKFIKDYKHSLVLDTEGVPTFESFISIPYVQDVFLGKNAILNSLQKENKELDDTLTNYEALIQEAFVFNTKSPYRESYIKQVVYTPEGKLKLEAVHKTNENFMKFQQEYRQLQLNKKLAEIFKPVGVTIGELSKAETRAGRVGVTDFTMADQMAQDFVSLIRVANNREGALAVSEEFAHLIIGSMRDNALIARSLKFLESNQEACKQILGDDYQDVVTVYNNDMALVAEEALGHILQQNLIRNNTDVALFDRTIQNVQHQFTNFKEDDVANAIADVNSMMSEIAQSLLNNSLTITKEQLINSRRQVQLNALSDRIARNLEILKNAKNTELKRYRISPTKAGKNFAENNVNLIESTKATELDSVITMCKYASRAVDEMKKCSSALASLPTLPIKDAFQNLRYIKGFIASYGNFIQQVYDALGADAEEEDSLVSTKSPAAEQLKDLISELNNLSTQLTTDYSRKAHKLFCNFLKPFLGEEVVKGMTNAKGEKLTVEELLHSSDKDISFFDRWLDSMGDSADLLLQSFDQIVKRAKDKAREKTIDSIREIAALRQKAEEAGITDFEWMFEKDSDGKKSGYYIRPVNYAEFYRQYKELNKQLTEKYGKNPSGENATKKIAEREAWLKKYAMSTFGKPMPKEELWKNAEYEKLSNKQKEILEEFLLIKTTLEDSLDEDKVSLNKAIQIRKNFSQRILDAGLSPSAIVNNLKEYYSKAFLDKIDDDAVFGQTTRTALMDFEGHEYMTVPILYTQLLENPDELSTDVFSTLMQYAYMANNYAEMDNIVDALETGRSLIRGGKRKVEKKRGSLPVLEKVKTKLGEYTEVFYSPSGTMMEDKLNDFFDSQVYGRYLKDSDTFEILGKSVNKNKLVSFVLNRSSLAQLGFNWLANTANVLTGACMVHIEAAAGEYFGVSELAKADAEYTKLLGSYIPELGSRIKESKLALFDELINFKGDFKTRVSDNQKKNWLQRIFGENIAFMGQDAGDHWLYNRTAIAMAMRTKVKVPGKGEMSVWDALEIVDSHGFKKMVMPKGVTDLNGKTFDMAKFSRQILHVNQSLFGIYNEEDSNAANRVIAGRLLMQYRKWIKPQFNKRFQAAQTSLTMDGKIEEGYYRTVLRICNELYRGQVQLGNVWDSLNDGEKANVKRALTELVMYLCVWALVNFIEWPDDKDRPWLLKMAEYSARRLQHELGGLTPSLSMAQEMLKNVKNPVPSSQVCIDTINLISSIVDPRDWTDELQSGPYKGMSTLEKNFLKTPFRGVAQFRQIKKFSEDIDTSILYYTRPY